MNWNTIVEQLGWQDVVRKWEESAGMDAEKDAAGISSPENAGAEKHNEHTENYISRQSTTARNQFIHSLTHNRCLESDDSVAKNPFLKNIDELFQAIAPAVAPTPYDNWFYRDPDGCDRGPFPSTEMADWFDVGYFDESVHVRNSQDSQYITIKDLIKIKSSEIFASYSLSDLIPLEYITQAAKLINPFRVINSNPAYSNELSQNASLKLKENENRCGFSVSDVCKELKKLNLKIGRDKKQNAGNSKIKFSVPSKNKENKKPNETLNFASQSPVDTKLNNTFELRNANFTPNKPIKFSIATPKSKNEIDRQKPTTTITRYNTPESMSMLNKVEKSQKYWMDVANTKLSGPPFAKRTSIKLNNLTFDAFLEPEARVSCLGNDCIEFLELHDIAFTLYSSCLKSMKDEHGANVNVLGHVFMTLQHNAITLNNFKLLLVPNLEQFVYLGKDFTRNCDVLAAEKLSPPEPILPCVKNQLERYSLELDFEQNQILERVMETFDCVTKCRLGVTDLEEHIITISGNHQPFESTAVYIEPIPIIMKEVEKLLALGIIEESSSRWKSPAMSVHSHGKLQLCLDLMNLNRLTETDGYRLPSKKSILEQIKFAECFSSLDLSHVSWQIPLEKQSRKYTAFEIDGRPRYQFTRMISGLKNTTQTIHRLFDKILSAGLRRRCVIISEEELLVLSRDFESHILHLTQVAESLKSAGIKINVAKSSFCLDSVNCLGWIVGGGSEELDPDAWKAISSFSLPKTRKQLKCFLQIAGWYKDLVPNYDKAVAPLCLLQHSKSSNDTLKFSSEACSAFTRVKRLLTNDAAYQGPNYDRDFYIRCNASFKRIAGLLYQVDDHGSKFSVAYHVKELSNTQRMYSITELEVLAVATSLQHFAKYLHGTHFYVVTDKNIMTWFLNQEDLPTRLASWRIKMQPHTFTVWRRKQVQIVHRTELDRVDFILKSHVETELRSRASEFTDYEELRNQIVLMPHYHPDDDIRNELIYCRRIFTSGELYADENTWKLYIPEKLREWIVQKAHTNSIGVHRNRKEMKAFLQTEFYWPSMGVELRRAENSCTKCSCSE